jgi:cytochrome c
MRFAAPFLALAILCLAPAARGADVAAGRGIFDSTCRNCHSLEVGVNKVGPSLWHIVGRPSGIVQGYMYSDALKNLHTTWTVEVLDNYLANPRSDVHGVQMYFKGLPHEKDRANILAYLLSQQQ